jgi:hypothetical protein
MGIAYRCDTRTGLTVAVWDGEITDDERRQHMAKLAADPDWANSRRLITDLTRVPNESRPTGNQIAEAAEVFLDQLAAPIADVKWAVVADRTFGDARNFGAQIEGEVRRMIVFNSVRTACVWLGVDAGDVQIIIDNLRQQVRAASR